MSASSYRARIFALMAIAMLLLIPFSGALANGIPPLTLWLNFDYATSEQPKLKGVQILSCDSAECSQPTLLLEYGACNWEGCEQLTPEVTAWQHLRCLAGRCVVVFNNLYAEVAPPYRLVGNFSDRVRESTLVADALPSYGDVAWEIDVQDAALAVSWDLNPPDPLDLYFGNVAQSFALTVIVELLVAAAALALWLKLRGRNLLIGLAYVLVASLISYPVTWIVWPSLGRFQPTEMRYTAIAIVTFVTAFTALLAVRSRQEGKARRVISAIAVALAPASVMITGGCFIFTTLGSAYGGTRYAVMGLPPGLIIPLAEAFAVGFEALLLYLLARKSLAISFVQALLISLLMNAASYLAGQALTAWF